MHDIETDALAAGVVELRRYTLHPGTRETLIELFDRAFIESQEACGMSVIGQFRDLDRPDRFVWLRGFPDMEARPDALAAFYDGPVWAAHRDAANATMVDFDDVLLLKPVWRGIELDPARRPAPGEAETHASKLIVATILPLVSGAQERFAALFKTGIRPRLEEAGAGVLATFITEKAANNYPRLPVRGDANVFVWLAAFDNAQEIVSADWQLPPEAAALLSGAPEILRLQPTARSLLRGMPAGSTIRR